MAFENKFGKSAVDAARNNALPPYLDILFREGGAGGADIEVLELFLSVDGWYESNGTLVQTVMQESVVSDGSEVILLSAEGEIYPVSGAGIKLASIQLDSESNVASFIFSAMEQPIEGIKTVVLVITSNSAVSARFRDILNELNGIYGNCISVQSQVNQAASAASTSATNAATSAASAADDAEVCQGIVDDAAQAILDNIQSSLLDIIHPIGDIITTSTNTNPTASVGGGTWVLVDKEFTPTKTAEDVSSSVTRNTTNATAIELYCTREGHQIAFTGYLTSAVSISNTNLEMAESITLSNLGASGFTFSPVMNAQSDLKHAIVLMDMDKSTGRLRTLDVVVRGSDTSIAATSGIIFQAVVLCDYTDMVDAKCNKFYWKRTA